MFIIIKFFSLKKELNSIYIINQDEKGTVIYTKENQFEIQDLNLNAFLKYYAKRSLKKDKTSDFDENSDTKVINGWRLKFSQDFSFSNKDTIFIQKKIIEYKNKKFEKQQILKT